MIHLKKNLSVFLLLLISAAPAWATPLRVLTLNFNSEMVRADSTQRIRDARYQELTTWIQANDPDIIFFQEAWNYGKDPSVAISLARELGYDVAYRLGMGLKGYFLDSNAILAKKSLSMHNELDIKLPHSAPELGNGKTWVIELGIVSYAVGVELTLPNGQPLFAYSTHLIGATEQDRTDQSLAIDKDSKARAIKHGVSWDKANVILGGDFNDVPTDPGPMTMLAYGYTDDFNAVHPGDTSCSNCGDPSAPYFDPYTMGAGQVPSQNSVQPSQRIDFLFSKSPSLKPIASTLVFTEPHQGVWMSDHYGIFTQLSADAADAVSVPNPIHDTEAPLPLPQILTLTTDQFLCANLEGTNHQGCETTLPQVQVTSPSGFVISNNSDFYVEVKFDGPGEVLTSNVAGLNPGDTNAFTFSLPGTYSFSVQSNVTKPNPYRAELKGSVVQVQ